MEQLIFPPPEAVNIPEIADACQRDPTFRRRETSIIYQNALAITVITTLRSEPKVADRHGEGGHQGNSL